MPTTVVIIDDHADFRTEARRLLESEGVQVIGEAKDGTSGIDLVRSLHPDVALVDVGLPDMDGFGVARELDAVPHGVKLVMISSRSISSYRSHLTTSPAVGFITKSDLSAGELTRVLDGGSDA